MQPEEIWEPYYTLIASSGAATRLFPDLPDVNKEAVSTISEPCARRLLRAASLSAAGSSFNAMEV